MSGPSHRTIGDQQLAEGVDGGGGVQRVGQGINIPLRHATHIVVDRHIISGTLQQPPRGVGVA